MEAKLHQLYPQLRIWNPAAAQVRALTQVLTDRGLLAGPQEPAGDETNARLNRFYASDLSDNFRQMIANIAAGQQVHLEFKSLEI